MMNKITKSITVLLFVLAISLMASPVLATCDEQYGAVCKEIELRIEKKVKDPVTDTFKENLSIHDYKFGPKEEEEEEIIFELKIKNIGDEKFEEVYVKDYLPNYLEHLSGDLDFTIYDLDPGEEVRKEIRAQAVSANQFPEGQLIICVTNTAEAWSGDKRDKGTAQVCLERKVLGVVELPPTGPENWFILLGLTLTSALAGLFFLSKAKDGNWKLS